MAHPGRRRRATPAGGRSSDAQIGGDGATSTAARQRRRLHGAATTASPGIRATAATHRGPGRPRRMTFNQHRRAFDVSANGGRACLLPRIANTTVDLRRRGDRRQRPGRRRPLVNDLSGTDGRSTDLAGARRRPATAPRTRSSSPTNGDDVVPAGGAGGTRLGQQPGGGHRLATPTSAGRARSARWPTTSSRPPARGRRDRATADSGERRPHRGRGRARSAAAAATSSRRPRRRRPRRRPGQRRDPGLTPSRRGLQRDPPAQAISAR